MLPPGARYLVRLLPFLAKTRLKALVRRVRFGLEALALVVPLGFCSDVPPVL